MTSTGTTEDAHSTTLGVAQSNHSGASSVGSKVAEKTESGIHSNGTGGRSHASGGEKCHEQDAAASRPMDSAGGAGEWDKSALEEGHAVGEFSSAPARSGAMERARGRC